MRSRNIIESSILGSKTFIEYDRSEYVVLNSVIHRLSDNRCPNSERSSDSEGQSPYEERMALMMQIY